MEDKYFNEFFDKLYNGKLNIYEDEEEETSDEEVVNNDLDGDGEEVNDDNEQNSILDELKKRITKRSIESIPKNVEFILKIDNYKSFGDSDNAKRFKERQLNGFWELYEIPNNKKEQPTWRKYIRKGNTNYDKGFKESLKNFIKDIDSGFEDRLKKLFIQSKLLKQSTIDSINTGIEKIRLVKKYSDLNTVEIRQLNGFWELYGMENNNTDTPNWRKYIREGNTNYIEGFKESLKEFIKNINPKFEKKLEVLYKQSTYDYGDIIPENLNYGISELNGILSKISDYKFMEKRIVEKIIEPILTGIEIIKENNYTDLDDNFKDRYLNGFWELYDMESNSNIEPTWRKYIREGNPKYIKGFKEYLKKFIEDKDSGFKERLNKLFEQKGESYEKTFTKEYDEKKYFEKINIDNESRIHNLDSKEINIIISSIINNYVNSEIGKDSQYLTTKLTDGDINYIKDNLVDPIYNNITNYLKNNKVVSYDLKCVQPLTNNGKPVIDEEDLIEVKDILKLDSYYSEYIASPVKKSDSIETPKGKEIYKVFVENLLEKIKNDSSGTFDKIINDVYTNISGMIIADDIYVPKENITLYISSQGQRYGRFTLRYNINTEGDFYKIEKPRDNEDDGKINEPLKIRELKSTEKKKLKPMSYVNPIYPKQGNVDESYDSYLDQLVENLFNTGKLFP